jgi:hypothetical protein
MGRALITMLTMVGVFGLIRFFIPEATTTGITIQNYLLPYSMLATILTGLLTFRATK